MLLKNICCHKDRNHEGSSHFMKANLNAKFHLQTPSSFLQWFAFIWYSWFLTIALAWIFREQLSNFFSEYCYVNFNPSFLDHFHNSFQCPRIPFPNVRFHRRKAKKSIGEESGDFKNIYFNNIHSYSPGFFFFLQNTRQLSWLYSKSKSNLIPRLSIVPLLILFTKFKM